MENHKILNPEDYNLGKRVKLIEISNNHLGILKQRKSRIIMKDGFQIMEVAKHLWKVKPKVKISLIISGPLCSKTRKYLNDNNVLIIQNDNNV